MKLSISKKIGCIVLSVLMTASVLLSNLVDIIPDAVNNVHADSVHTEHEGEDKDGSCHNGWTPWGEGENEEKSMPDTAGNYYLTNDVTLSATWEVPAGTTNLCLNGHSITAAGEFDTIDVVDGATLNLYDESGNNGKITHEETYSGCGVNVYGALEIYGGKIIDNKSVLNGGGLYVVGGELLISGGEISGNTTSDDGGGGVYISGDSTLTMTGGIISNNKALGNKDKGIGVGGGVFCEGTFNISGGKIVENEAAFDGKNIYVGKNKFIPDLTKDITIDGGLYSRDYTTVCFYKNGNDNETDPMTSQIIKKDEDVQLKANPFTCEGCVFIGWNTKSDRSGTFYYDGENVNVGELVFDDLILYAEWDKTHEEHDKPDTDECLIHEGWTAWTKDSELPTEPGSYFLTKDVSLSSRWDVPEGTTNLCLNGHSIIANGNFNVINIGGNTTLNLYDVSENRNYGTITHAKDANNEPLLGSGIFVYNGGKLTIAGGKIIDNTSIVDGGGGIYVTDGEVTISGGVISKNKAISSGSNINNQPTDEEGCGGGIYILDGELTITGGEISNNEATYEGGGVYIGYRCGKTTITGGLISNNKATGGNGCGGGIFAAAGELTITGGEISNNEAKYLGGGICAFSNSTVTISSGKILNNEVIDKESSKGGGIYVYKGTLSLSDSKISGNISQLDGSGIFVDEGSVMISGSEISDNKGEYGGGIFVLSGTLTVSDCTISGNTSNGFGGGMSVFECELTISDSIISNNVAGSGGGVYVSNSAICNISGCTFMGNTASENDGGVDISGGKVTISDSVFSGNTAGKDVGGISAGGKDVKISDCVISENKAGRNCGGLSIGSDVKVSDVIITNNTSAGFGGGVCIDGDGSEITGCTISENTALCGGGIYYDCGTITNDNISISESIISENIAQEVGGGIYIADGNVIISDVIISENDSVDGEGGGIYKHKGSLVITDGEISNNKATYYGGGIAIEGGKVTVSGTSISDNTAGEDGGGIYDTGGNLEFSDGTISNNIAGRDGGGVYMISGYTFNLSDSTISGNTVQGRGGGVFCDAPFIMSGGIVTANTAEKEGKNVYINDLGTFTPENDPEIDGGLYDRYYTTICYFANGGDGKMRSQIIPKNTDTALSKNTYTRDGFVCTGWNTQSNGSGDTYADEEKVNVSSYEGLTLYAQWVPDRYKITFVDGDGTTLQSGDVAYNTVPKYAGTKTPTKATDAENTYTFAGWTDGTKEYSLTEDLPAAKAVVTYKPVFTSTVNEYEVRFVNEDGTELQSGQVAYGEVPEYKGTTPTMDPDAQYTYTYTGWKNGDSKYDKDSTLPKVTGDVTYTAVYTGTINQYTITFVDEDGTVLSSEKYDYGTAAAAIVKPTDPTKKADVQYTYTFSGWTPVIANVTADATYTATYKATVNEYTVTFISDGKVISTKDYPYGTAAADITVPADPTIAPTAQYTYTFEGWTPALAEVTEDATYTAQFSTKVNKYTVTFVDEDGTVISSAVYDYGTAAKDIVKPADPTKAPTAQYTYTFSDWTPEITNVIADVTYTAMYKAAINEYTIKFVDEDGTVFQSSKVAYGETPSFTGTTPTKKATAQYTYTFSGWTPEIANVTADATYTATYKAAVNEYTVTFISDGKVISTKDYPYGTAAADITVPADPTIAPTAQYTYTFEGWTPALKDVTEDATYTAEFSSTVNEYTIKFVDEDGTVLQTGKIAYGETPVYTGETPSKKANAQFTYKFSGWTPEIAKVTGDATYTATYKATVNEYTIKFVEEDGTVLQSSKVAYGETPVYSGETPTKKATAQYTYTFSGWTPEITKVTADATYTATYKATVNEYTIKFVDEDGTVLQSSKVAYGETPAFTGTTPSKKATAQYTYTFSGWTPEITKVTADATYTATYKATVNEYTITFVNADGTVLQTSKVPYGELPAYTGVTPVKAEDEMYTYSFSGWTPELAKVTGDATYTAVFTANAKPASYYLKSLTGDGLGGDIVAVFGRTIDDANAISYLDRVESDGKTLTRDKDYTAESGSVIITLKKEYLDTLSEGKHTLTVYFKDGQSVSLEYTVKHISNEAENIPSTGEKIAKTLFIGGACVLLAAAVAGTAIVIKKKRKKEDA